MKNLLLLLNVILFSTTIAQAQNVEKTLVKSFNLKGAQQVILDFDGDIEVQERKGEILRVQMSIGIEGTSSMLKSLITAGRYNLKSAIAENGTIISQPGMQKQVMVGGKKLVEEISFVVYVPENVTVSYGSTAATQLSPEAISNPF